MRWLLGVTLEEIVQLQKTTLISQLDQPKKSLWEIFGVFVASDHSTRKHKNRLKNYASLLASSEICLRNEKETQPNFYLDMP